MKKLTEELKEKKSEKGSFRYGNLIITYPGYKKQGDYKLTENGVAPKHTDLVTEIYNATTKENLDKIIRFLDDVYLNGLNAATSVFSLSFKEKLYWVTLQEEINYPQPKYAGRKLSFQRFYEAALAKTGITSLETVLLRTNNHGRAAPKLLDTQKIRKPSFYQ